jgi:hypothetical protein
MRPSGARATMSVKVPPRSIQNCQYAFVTAMLLNPSRGDVF